MTTLLQADVLKVYQERNLSGLGID